MKHILKRVCIVGAALFFCLALTNAALQRFQKHTPKTVYIIPEIEYKKQHRKRTKLYEHLKPKPVDHKHQFYNTIIENNIFAPLGYKLPKRAPIYRLLGTNIPIHKAYQATAILQETTDKKRTHIVNIGTKLDEDTFVMDIQPKQIILKKGTHRIPIRMATMRFLK